MRITLLTNGLGFGGAERIVEALADDLRDYGDDIAIVTTTRGGPIEESLRHRGHRVTVLGLRGIWDTSIVLKLGALVRAHRSDVVHSHLAVSDIASAASNIIHRAARLCTVHNPGVELGRVKRWLWLKSLGTMDRVFAVSQAAQQKLPCHIPSTIVRPSLIDLGHTQLSRLEARTRLGLDPIRPIVLAIGRLAHIKGLDVLNQAVSHIKTPGVMAAVIGDGPMRSHLLNSDLTLLGPRPDASALVRAADVLVLPSRSEGFPQAPLHAMAASIPVVATRVGGTPEVVVDGVTGILVPSENPRALATALDRVLQTPNLAAQLGSAGRQRIIEEKFTRQGMVEATRAQYASVLR